MARMREACRSLPGRLELPTLRFTVSRSSQLREREREGERDGNSQKDKGKRPSLGQGANYRLNF